MLIQSGPRLHKSTLLSLFYVGVFLAGSGWATLAHGAQGDCSQPLSNGNSPVSTDCLFILNAAVSLTTCSPVCICVPSGSLPISATDALVCLQKAVGQNVPLDCPCGSGGSTSTTSSTRLETTTTLLVIETTTTTLAPLVIDAQAKTGYEAGICENGN